MSDSAEATTPDTVGWYYQNARQEIRNLLPRELDTVLEVGCGAGATMAWLRSLRPIRYAAGVELFPDAAKLARSVFDAVEVADVNSARLEFAEDRFDAILALDVLEHLADPEAVVRRLRNKLRPNGLFIASIPNVAHHSVSLPLLFRGAWEYQDSGLLDRTHLHFFTRRSALALFTDAGFEIVALELVRMGPRIRWLRTHPNPKVRWYTRRTIDSIFRWPRHLFAFQFLIAARQAPSGRAVTSPSGRGRRASAG